MFVYISIFNDDPNFLPLSDDYSEDILLIEYVKIL